MVLYEYFGKENNMFFEKKCFDKILYFCIIYDTVGPAGSKRSVANWLQWVLLVARDLRNADLVQLV